MFNARHYANNNDLQRKDASLAIDKYLKFMKLNANDVILDVGAGDGGALQDLLLPKLPRGFRKLILLDFNEAMLKLAHKKFKNNPKIEYLCMDIISPPILEIYANVDHIFSFYCLQLVKNHRQVIQNLFDMLKPGGDMLLTIVANHFVFDVYEKLADIDKWRPFMKTFGDFSPYQHSANPVKEIEELLKAAGFIDYKCELVNTKFAHPSSKFWDWACGINPFIKFVPKEDIESYKEDYLGIVKTHKKISFQTENGKEGSVHVSYQFLTVFASKPRCFAI